MADTTHATPAFNLVAIDIARYWNYVLIETAAGQKQRFRMANTAADCATSPCAGTGPASENVMPLAWGGAQAFIQSTYLVSA
jgi:hypothetical protein